MQPQPITHHYADTSVHFVPRSQRMLVNSGERELTLHEVATGKLIHRMTDTQPAIGANDPEHLREEILLSPDGRFAVADYGTRYSIVWNLETGKQALLIDRENGNNSIFGRLHFSEDSRRLLTRMSNSKKPATIWDLESGEVTELGERERLEEIEGFPPSARTLRARSKVPAPDVQEALERLKPHLPASLITAEKTGDGRRLIVYENDGGMAVWDIASESEICRCYQFDDGRRWLTISPTGESHGDLEHVRYRKEGTLEVVKPSEVAKFGAGGAGQGGRDVVPGASH